MGQSWLIYGTVSRKAAEKAVDATYVKLSGIVGDDLAEHLEPGEKLQPPTLGRWPDLLVSEDPIPTADAVTKSAKKGAKTEPRVEEAAVARMAKCVSAIEVDVADSFDPALVSAFRTLFAALGPSVLTQGDGSLVTSETILAEIAKRPDLPAALKAVVAKKKDDDDDDDEDEDEDDEDEDEEDDEDEDDEDEDEEEEEDENAPAPESARPENLRGTLAAIAGIPKVRRKAGELLGGASEIIGRVAERLARVGPESDEDVARALAVTEKDVLKARKDLAKLLRRAEDR